ncbi:MAG TPA: hypothetical protein VFK32_07155 [Tepidiformaceae bacterium]|nr:hypothetical protein [Tepidiformaceae bacterium]
MVRGTSAVNPKHLRTRAPSLRFAPVSSPEVVPAVSACLRVRLADGTFYSSLSAAGSAVMDGVACNGWRFWSIDGEGEPAHKQARSGPMKKQRGSRDLMGWSDARLTELIESIRRDLTALEGDILQESEELLDRAEAEAERRGGPEATL